MKRRLVIEPEAEADLREAYQWYEAQRKGLGEQFMVAMEAALANVQRQPESCQMFIPKSAEH